MFRLRFTGGDELILTEAGKKKRAGVWLVTPAQLDDDLGHLGPDALGLDAAALGEILERDRRQLHPLLRDQRAIAGIGRAHANEILLRARLSPFKASTELSDEEIERLAAAIARGPRRARSSSASRGRATRRLPHPQPARRAVPAVRHADRPRRLRGAHDLLLPELPDGRPAAEGPPAVAPAALSSNLDKRQRRSTVLRWPRAERREARGRPPGLVARDRARALARRRLGRAEGGSHPSRRRRRR